MADDPAILTPPRSEAFDAVAGIRSGMEGFRRAWPILFVGGCIKGCTEGGATGNPGGATQLGDAGSGGAPPEIRRHGLADVAPRVSRVDHG